MKVNKKWKNKISMEIRMELLYYKKMIEKYQIKLNPPNPPLIRGAKNDFYFLVIKKG